MKNLILILIFTVVSVTVSQAQLSGRTTLYDKGGWSMISVNEKVPYITTDGDGNFSIELPEILNKVLLLESWISIEIINIPKNVEANLGDIEIPMRKSVTSEYEKFTEEQKKMIIPIYCNTQLVGYEYLNQLENPKINFTCNKVKYELANFDFDIKGQKVIIDWKNLKLCAN